jgi:hypothetical protein
VRLAQQTKETSVLSISAFSFDWQRRPLRGLGERMPERKRRRGQKGENEKKRNAERLIAMGARNDAEVLYRDRSSVLNGGERGIRNPPAAKFSSTTDKINIYSNLRFLSKALFGAILTPKCVNF